MIVVYGLKNCDSCRKAIAFLQARNRSFALHDLRSDGLPIAAMDDWLERLGWEQVLNRRSTTWRGLSPSAKEALDAKSVRLLLLDHPTLVKRPVIQVGAFLMVGFSKAQEAQLEAALTSAD